MHGQTLSQNSAPDSLCILRLSAIGDVCHAVAIVQQIQKKYPTTKITWVIGKIELSLLQGLTGIEFVVFDKRAGFRGYLDLKKKLSGRTFDVVFQMQVALRASLASLCIRGVTKIGFDSSRAKEGHSLFINKKIKPQQHPHVIEGFKAFAEAIGVYEERFSWHMPVDESVMQKYLADLPLETPYVVICPAASKAERNWTIAGYAAMAGYLHAKGFKIVLCGGPTELERQLSDKIKTHASCSNIVNHQIVDLVGKTTLVQLLAVLKHAHLVLAPDTGPAHMAVTVNTPVVGLYAHSNPRRTGPFLFQRYIVNAYDDAIKMQYGKPWQELPWGTRAKGESLMETISVEQVKTSIDEVLKDFYPQFCE